jgi:glyoxylase-like metal-dependent hydrolase (beta-lactamase superfamily II)
MRFAGIRPIEKSNPAKESMMITRSSVVLFVCCAMISLPAGAQEENQPPPAVARHLKGSLHEIECNGAVAVVASIGKDGTLLVDTGYTFTAQAAVEKLEELGGSPARIIVNTHGDGDHVGGNAVLGEKAVIIAHPEVYRRMASYFALPPIDAAGKPTVTLTEETTIYFNDEVIRLLPVPGGHTSGDVVVHFTKNDIACIGDLALAGRFANADPARGGNALRLIEVLKELRRDLPADTTLIAAHGGAMTMEELSAYIEMVEGTVSAVKVEIDAGHSLEEIIERNPLAPWQEWADPEFGLSSENWTREIYASLQGTRRQSICAPMTEILVSDGIDAAIARYRQLKDEQPDSWSFAEPELNMLGYQLLARDRVDDAIAIFELNVETYPEAFNTFDSLGEALMTAGRTEESIANYERSLELNPDNTNATAMLARLRGQ